MTHRFLGAAAQHIRALLRAGNASKLSDGQLLEVFTRGKDEAAFTELVERHSAMVQGVCWRVLHHGQDTEDVFQATFLVLIHKAASLRQHPSLRGWLYQVAYRLACQARRSNQRWHSRQRRRAGDGSSAPDAARSELCLMLDDELHRMPEKYRLPLLLCYLEGQRATRRPSNSSGRCEPSSAGWNKDGERCALGSCAAL
jgi:RNA polymerase sigma factor (sigma-70 family)